MGGDALGGQAVEPRVECGRELFAVAVVGVEQCRSFGELCQQNRMPGWEAG